MIFQNAIKNKKTLIENTSISEAMQETESKHYLEVKNEVLVYLSQYIIMQKDRPVAWWGANKSNFKQLTPIAQKYLSWPPSFVESERLSVVEDKFILREEIGWLQKQEKC